MTRVLLVGDRSDRGFAARRTRHFAAALDGFAVEVVDWREPGSVGDYDLVVSASNYGPTRVATRLAGDDHPLWIDVAGDPFAEAQLVGGQAAAAEALATWGPALARADAFSVVCEPGAHALIGALGATGRLPLLPPGNEGVNLMPVAMDFPDPPGPPREPGTTVALVGGFNTWFDDETLAAALLLAMDEGDIRCVVTGGPIEGHYTAGYARFRESMSRHSSRFIFHEWLPHEQLAEALAPAHLLVTLDRPGPEAALGSRTRLLYGLHQGLRVVTTGGSPLARKLARDGLATLVPMAHEVGREVAARALAREILSPRAAPPVDALRSRLSVAATTAPLRTWALNPVVRPRVATPFAPILAERDALRAELEALRGSVSYRWLDWARRGRRR